MTEAESLSIPLPDGNCAIAIDPYKVTDSADGRFKLAHELGHCATGSFYNRWAVCDLRQKHENRANRWAVRRLIPEEDLAAAVASGITEPWDLAEYFDVPEVCIRMAWDLYRVTP